MRLREGRFGAIPYVGNKMFPSFAKINYIFGKNIIFEKKLLFLGKNLFLEKIFSIFGKNILIFLK